MCVLVVNNAEGQDQGAFFPKKRSFDTAFKLKVIEHAERSTNREAAGGNRIQLESLPSKKKREEGRQHYLIWSKNWQNGLRA